MEAAFRRRHLDRSVLPLRYIYAVLLILYVIFLLRDILVLKIREVEWLVEYAITIPLFAASFSLSFSQHFKGFIFLSNWVLAMGIALNSAYSAVQYPDEINYNLITFVVLLFGVFTLGRLLYWHAAVLCASIVFIYLMTAVFVPMSAGDRMFHGLILSIAFLIGFTSSYAIELLERREYLAVESLKSANLTLKDINQLKSSFIGIAAHDLRNPLQSIVGYSDLILTRELNSTTATKIKRIHDAAGEMINVIATLLEISKMEDKKELNYSCFDFTLLVREAIAELEMKHPGLSAELKIHLPSVVAVQADRERISHVVNYLLHYGERHWIATDISLFTDQHRIGLHVDFKKTRHDSHYDPDDIQYYKTRALVGLHHGNVEFEITENGVLHCSLKLPRRMTG